MIIALLAILLILSCVACFVLWLAMTSLIMFMVANEYTLPTQEETKACAREVLRRTFRIGQKGVG